MLLDSTSKLNLICNQASFEFSKVLIAAAAKIKVDADAQGLAQQESTVGCQDESSTTAPTEAGAGLNNHTSTQIEATLCHKSQTQHKAAGPIPKDGSKPSSLPEEEERPKSTSAGKAQMTELFESLAAIRNNLQTKQRTQTRLAELVAKTSASVKVNGSSVTAPVGISSSITSSAAGIAYPSLFSQKSGGSSKAFPTLSKLDSRPSFRPAATTVSVENGGIEEESISVAYGDSKSLAIMSDSASSIVPNPVVDPKPKMSTFGALKQNEMDTKSTTNHSLSVAFARPLQELWNPTEEAEKKDEGGVNSKEIDTFRSLALSPDPLTKFDEVTPMHISHVSDDVDNDEVSMELDTPPVDESSASEVLVAHPSQALPTLLPPPHQEVNHKAAPSNVYRGGANSFLPPANPSIPKQGYVPSTIPLTKSTFLPSFQAGNTKEAPRAKPVIHALKVAEMAAKKEKEEKEKRLKEKEARKIALEKKKGLVGVPSTITHQQGTKRPHPSGEEAPKKKIAPVALAPNHQSKMQAAYATHFAAIKPKLPIADNKGKAPLLSHASVHMVHQGVKNPILPPMSHQTPVSIPKQIQSSGGPSSIVDTNTGEIVGLHQEASSDYESSPAYNTNSSKPAVPVWAQSPQLRQALQNQRKVNPDEIFAGMEAPNLKEILGNVGKVSLGIFEMMEELSTQEQEEYRRAMGFR